MNPASATQLTGVEVLARCRASGDETWFAELVGRHRKAIVARCRMVLHHQAEAGDMARATFLRASRKSGQYEGRSCCPRLSAIARSICLNRMAAQAPVSVAPESAPEPALAENHQHGAAPPN